MREHKKINLLPKEVIEKNINRYFKLAFCAVGAVLVLALFVQYGRIGVLSWQIGAIQKENERYEQEKKNIAELQIDIESYQAFLRDYENNNLFPFSLFMSDLENKRPASVSIISVDSDDRLINEGKQEDEEEKKDKKEEKVSDSEPPKTEDTATATPMPEPKIQYESDLSGKSITVRGYGNNQDDITRFIYELSSLPYIADAVVSGIEEHEMPDGRMSNIFELKLRGGAA